MNESRTFHDIALLELLFAVPTTIHTAMAVRKRLNRAINPNNVYKISVMLCALVHIQRLTLRLPC